MAQFNASLKKKMRVAVVGLGRISTYHLDAIREYGEDLELVAVCDTVASNLDKFSDQPVACFSDLEDLLRSDVADLIVLCTPSGLHAEQTVLCAKYKKHVITEKPMATTWQDGLRMVEACDKAGVRLFVVKQNRHNATLKRLKQAVSEDRFGRIHMVNSNVFWSRPQNYYDLADWRGTKQLDGGAFMNQASHYVDLLSWLFGPIESLQAFTTTRERSIEMEDTGVASLRWRSGALGSINVTMCTSKDFEGSLTVIGEKGTVRIGGVAMNEIQHWDFLEKKEEDLEVLNANYETESVYGFGHRDFYQTVISDLRSEASFSTCGRQGLQSLEVLSGIYLSASSGDRVSLPLEN